MTCWDCKRRVATRPAIVMDGAIMRLCQLCWNKWAPFMHKAECNCPHCDYCRAIVKEESKNVIQSLET